MTDRSDNPLADVDLSAWQPPAPGDGLADAVIARLREPASAVAVDQTGQTGHKRARRRWLIGGGILAVVGVAAVIGVRGLVRAPRDGRGTVAATQPSHLDLGTSSAELDAGVEVTWQRAGHRLVVTQSHGTATWRIAGDDTLVIDAGAAVASVEASGASLRVEVNMNLTDARVIGATVATAAVVSLVTVVVYEGYVKVSGNGQTVNVAPGNTVAVGPGTPPRSVDDRRAVAGVAGRDSRDQQALLATGAELEKKLATCGNGILEQPFAIERCDVAALRRTGEIWLQQGLDSAALASFEAAIWCGDTSATMIVKSFMAACRSRNEAKARRYYDRLPAERRESIKQICVRNGITF